MKNEQIMIYAVIAILYGAVGWLLYSMYEKKENYDDGWVFYTPNYYSGGYCAVIQTVGGVQKIMSHTNDNQENCRLLNNQYISPYKYEWISTKNS